MAKAKGRPTKLNDELIEKLCKVIAMGVPQKDAAMSVGISESAFYKYMERGEKAKSGLYFHLMESITKARSDAITFHLQNINHVARGGEEVVEIREHCTKDGVVVKLKTIKTTPRDARQSNWILERRHPEKFGRKVELSGEVKTPVFVTNYTDADILAGMDKEEEASAGA